MTQTFNHGGALSLDVGAGVVNASGPKIIRTISHLIFESLEPLRHFYGGQRLLRGVAEDFALGQRLLQLVNLSLGEVGVVSEIQQLQFRELLQSLHIGQFVAREIQLR